MDSSEIIEENNFYPFGLEHKGYNNVVSANANSAAQKYGFGGKEHQDELGLGWIDITARNYDATLGRWMNLDPLAEDMRRYSPYTFAFDNPIYFIDPDGMMPIGLGEMDEEKNFDSSITDGPQHITSTVVNDKGEIIDYKDDGDDNIYLNERTAENIIGKEQKDKVYSPGEYLDSDDLFSSSLNNLPDGFRFWKELSVKTTEFEVSPLLGGLKNAAKYVVYIVKGSKGIKYVGITNNFARRAAEHLRARGFVIEPLLKNLSKADARALEQVLIEIYKLGGKEGQAGQLLNKINSIAKTNPKYAGALKRGYELLKTIGVK